jgi:hypothetical protein
MEVFIIRVWESVAHTLKARPCVNRRSYAVSTDVVVSAHFLRLIRKDWGNRGRVRFILRNLPYFSGMTEKNHENFRQTGTLIEIGTRDLCNTVWCSVRYSYANKNTSNTRMWWSTVSEDKRLVRGLEIRGSECESETWAREECIYFYIQLCIWNVNANCECYRR